MRALVIGGSGQIGSHLLRALERGGHSAVGTYATVPFPGLVRLDASETDAAVALLRDHRPDLVFYPAGWTWVDGCERDPARAFSANRDQPLSIAVAAAELKARFVYFSTDYVFDGRGGPYVESSPPKPLSEYGRAKLAAERALLEALGDSVLIARTAWVFGPERQGKNFAYQLVKSLREGRRLACPTDQFSHPTYGPDVARVSLALAEAGASGLFHVAGPRRMSRVEFATSLAEGFGLDRSLILGKTTAETGQGAPRPLAGGLVSERLADVLSSEMTAVEAAVADFRNRPSAEGWATP